LDATNGNVLYSNNLGAVIILRFDNLGDVNGNGHPDFLPSHTSSTARVIDGLTGSFVWSQGLVDKSYSAIGCPDISGDGINDVFIGTLYQNNMCYFLNGADGSIMNSLAVSYAVDAITALPDINGDQSTEMIVGLRDGTILCLSGGLGLPQPPSVSTQPVTNIESTSAQFNGNLTSLGGSSTSEVWFVWDTVYHTQWQDYPHQSAHTNQTSTGPFSFFVDTLIPNTEYHVRAVAMNSVDTKQGGDVTFSTPLSAPIVTTMPATQVNPTSAELNGNLENLGGDDSCEVWFVWDEAYHSQWTDYAYQTSATTKNTTGHFSEIINGLNPSIIYHFRAVSSNIHGTSQGEDLAITKTIQITQLNIKWNLISINCNETVGFSDITVSWNGSNYTWFEATNLTNALIDASVFGWNRATQSYYVATSIEPGKGYWLYSNQPCTLTASNITISQGNYVTNCLENWNIFGIPYNEMANKTQIRINGDTWDNAVAGAILDDSVFGWDRQYQSYYLATSFAPGESYWLYSYQPCVVSLEL
jgi:hypothetical protein